MFLRPVLIISEKVYFDSKKRFWVYLPTFCSHYLEILELTWLGCVENGIETVYIFQFIFFGALVIRQESRFIS